MQWPRACLDDNPGVHLEQYDGGFILVATMKVTGVGIMITMTSIVLVQAVLVMANTDIVMLNPIFVETSVASFGLIITRAIIRACSKIRNNDDIEFTSSVESV